MDRVGRSAHVSVVTVCFLHVFGQCGLAWNIARELVVGAFLCIANEVEGRESSLED